MPRQRILLHRSDGEPLAIRRTKVPLAGVTVTAYPVDNASPQSSPPAEATPTPWGAAKPQEIETTEAGGVWLEMVGGRTHSPQAVIRTRSGLRPTTLKPRRSEIPFTIRVRPLIEPRPAVVRMWTSPTTSDPGRSAILTLQPLRRPQVYRPVGRGLPSRNLHRGCLWNRAVNPTVRQDQSHRWTRCRQSGRESRRLDPDHDR